MAASLRTRLRKTLLRSGGTDVEFVADPYLPLIAEEGHVVEDRRVKIVRGFLGARHPAPAGTLMRVNSPRFSVGEFNSCQHAFASDSSVTLFVGSTGEIDSEGRRS
jgi:hypothetical protein